MYCLQLMKFDVSNTSYCVQVENGALLHDVERSWKITCYCCHWRSWKLMEKILGLKCGNPEINER